MILSGGALREAMLEAMDFHKELVFMSPWGGWPDQERFIEKLLAHEGLIHSSLGMAWHQTNPRLLRALVGLGDKVRVRWDASEEVNGRFFFFYGPYENFDLFIGSATLSTSGLARNQETMMHLTDKDFGVLDAMEISKDYQAYALDKFNQAETISEEVIDLYAQRYQALQMERIVLSGRLQDHPKVNPNGQVIHHASAVLPITASALCWTWEAYEAAIKTANVEQISAILELTHEHATGATQLAQRHTRWQFDAAVERIKEEGFEGLSAIAGGLSRYFPHLYFGFSGTFSSALKKLGFGNLEVSDSLELYWQVVNCLWRAPWHDCAMPTKDPRMGIAWLHRMALLPVVLSSVGTKE